MDRAEQFELSVHDDRQMSSWIGAGSVVGERFAYPLTNGI
jgi:hypothetical protein